MPSEVKAVALGILTRNETTPEAMHRSGLALLLTGNIDGALARLKSAAVALKRADVWNDYAAALLAASEAHDSLLPAVDSLVASTTALKIDARHAAAHFNRGLALERLGLLLAARNEWSRSSEDDPGWSAEQLRARRDVEGQLESNVSWPALLPALNRAIERNDVAETRRIVRGDPHNARVWGEGVYTANWADATLRGDRGTAEAELRTARVIGTALHDLFGEALLADAIRTIDAADGEARLRLARAYLTYRAGRIAHGKAQRTEAQRLLEEAVRSFARAGSPMEFVARYYVASVQYAQLRIPEASASLDVLAAAHYERRGYFALAGQIGWERGLCALVRGSFSAALDIFEGSRVAFERLGETDMAASFEEFAAATFDFIGDSDQAWQARRRALDVFAITGNDARTVTALETATRSMIMRAEWTRARPVLDIAIEHAIALRDATRSAEGLLQRAMVRASVGEHEGALADVTAARQWVSSIVDSGERQSLAAGVFHAEAYAVAQRDPLRAADLLTRALRVIEHSERTAFAAQILLERGRIERRTGQGPAARSSFAAGLQLVEQQRVGITDLQQRAALLATATALYHAAIDLALEYGDGEQAFALAERSRARALLDGISERTGQPSVPMQRDELVSALARDAAIVEYLVTDERVVAFVLKRGSFEAVQLRGASGWEELVPPVLPSLRGIRHLTIVPDAAMSSVSFLTLRDPASGVRIIDSMSVAMAPSASIAVRCARAARDREERSLLAIAASTFDQRSRPDVRRLDWTEREARQIAKANPRAVVVAAGAATPSRILREMPQASRIHFAGHAIARPTRPLDSVLLVAPDEASGEISASQIARLDLHQTRLVYLSACRSALPASGDGVQNLATAFLIAGASTIVATTEDVGDEQAARFATGFYERYGAGMGAASALRETMKSLPGSENSMILIGGSPELVIDGRSER